MIGSITPWTANYASFLEPVVTLEQVSCENAIRHQVVKPATNGLVMQDSSYNFHLVECGPQE